MKKKAVENTLKVSISNGNDKMGRVKSVSLPPVTTCKHWETCGGKGGICYALAMYRNGSRPNIKWAWDRNLEILKTDRDSYFLQIRAAAMLERFFRWHVSGDIIDIDYLSRMCKLARECKETQFLAFTKNYEDVNEYLKTHKKPRNLQLIFSLPFNGAGIDNPHNLPTAAVVLKGQEPADNWKICGGNCENCACRGVGCWELKKGDIIAFNEH